MSKSSGRRKSAFSGYVPIEKAAWQPAFTRVLVEVSVVHGFVICASFLTGPVKLESQTLILDNFEA
jgi:hypothetical protein